MRVFKDQSILKRAHSRNKKSSHPDILTLDDLPKTNSKYSVLIAQLTARYKAAKEKGVDALNPKSEDYSE